MIIAAFRLSQLELVMRLGKEDHKLRVVRVLLHVYRLGGFFRAFLKLEIEIRRRRRRRRGRRI